MLFTLEALKARHGDSLILHYGSKSKPQFIVIDGGPAGVYKNALRPRLTELHQRFAEGDRLAIEILMISHIDDDHLKGILELTEQLIEEEDTTPNPYRVKTLWHNSFADDLATGGDTAPAEVAEASAELASLSPDGEWKGESNAVLANVSQGRDLRANARKLDWPLNEPFDELVLAPESGGKKIKRGQLELNIIGPLQPQLDALREDWKKEVEKLRKAQGDEFTRVAELLDKSVYNLASIICLAEFDDKTMLLTGDARGDHILEGLEAAELIEPDQGQLELDILKLPHHGSDRNVNEEFFKRLPAKHYVVSGDGGFGNPEVGTFELISKARSDNDFTLHLTYRDGREGVGEKLSKFFAAEKRNGRDYEVVFCEEDKLSFKVDLLDEVDY